VSWADSDEQALEQARKLKGAQPPDHYTDDWHIPHEMYEHGEREVSDDEFAQNIIASSDPGRSRSACASWRSSAAR
jgi:coenzyme F420-dependent glucose-6-phosphate dehydrogenase